MAEYEADHLALASHNEKRLEKAERSAEGKALKRRKAANGANSLGVPPKFCRIPPKEQRFMFTQTPRTNPVQPSQHVPVRNQLNMVGPCLSCGEMGHLK